MKKNFLRSVLILLVLNLFSMVRAEDLGAVRTRIEQRLSQVDVLKGQGAVGENNGGYLEVRGGGADVAAVVAAENKDREMVYAVLAQKTGTSAEQVGKSRAAKILQSASSGVWVQDEGGNWKKK